MYTSEIKQLMEYRNYLLTVKEYLDICNTSPQIKVIHYDAYNDNFYIETEEQYKVYFKVKKEVKQ